MHTSICRTTGAPHGLHTAPQTASSWDKIRVFHAPPARDSVLVLGPRPEFQIVTRRPGRRCCCCCGGRGGGASGTAPLTRRTASAILTGGRVNVTLHGPVRVCYRSHGLRIRRHSSVVATTTTAARRGRLLGGARRGSTEGDSRGAAEQGACPELKWPWRGVAERRR